MVGSHINKRFRNLLNKLGSYIIVEYDIGEQYPMFFFTKVSIIPATEAAYNVTDREFLFKGDFIVPDIVLPEKLAGQYFYRDGIGGKKYIFLSAIIYPEYPSVGYMYAVQSNTQISIYDPYKFTDEYLNEKTVFKRTQANVYAYFTSTLRSAKIQNDGRLDQAIYSIILPARYKIAPEQRISRMEFVEVEKVDENGNKYYETELAEVNYQVESIDMSLVQIDMFGEISGIVSAQLSKDLRAFKNEIPPEPEPEEPIWPDIPEEPEEPEQPEEPDEPESPGDTENEQAP